MIAEFVSMFDSYKETSDLSIDFWNSPLKNSWQRAAKQKNVGRGEKPWDAVNLERPAHQAAQCKVNVF
ncbi:MAG: hypothetical protein JO317_04565 [Verrucomicrobiae bacterium]|nr:hypothetical protein [Verrucomicrobiae bacterium]